MSRAISEAFTATFMGVPLERQIEQCESYELAGLFRRLLPAHPPILEAGSGSGRWVAWFRRSGWEATGLDWSEALCARAREQVPGARFEAGDMRAMPFADGEFGAIVALGSIEHAAEGPMAALREFRRVLRPGGIAIITVPYGGWLYRSLRGLRTPLERIKAIPAVRRAFGRKPWGPITYAQARGETRREWFPVFGCNAEGWYFFEYRFDDRQMQRFLDDAGLRVVETFPSQGDEGILHCFGSVAGRFDYDRAQVVFTPLGRLLRRLVPLRYMGLMRVYVVQRPADAA